MAYDSTIAGYAVDRDYSRTVNIGSCNIPFVRSFRIRETSFDSHTLTINQTKLIGTYPTRAAAFGALVGCVKAAGGGEDSAIKSIENMIDNNRGIFEAGIVDRVGSYGLNRVAGLLMEGCNALVFGDSYSYAYMNIGRPKSWRPKNWVGGLVMGANSSGMPSSDGPYATGATSGGSGDPPAYNYAGNTTTFISDTDATESDPATITSTAWGKTKYYKITGTIGENPKMWNGWFNKGGFSTNGGFSAGVYLNEDGTQNYFFPNGYTASVILEQNLNTITSFNLFQGSNQWHSGSGTPNWYREITCTETNPADWTVTAHGSADSNGPIFKSSASSGTPEFGAIELTNPSFTASPLNDDVYLSLQSTGDAHTNELIGAYSFAFKSTESTKGLWLGHIGFGGKRATDFTAKVSNEYLKFLIDTMYDVDVCILQFAHNDFASAVTGAGLKTNIEGAINKIRAAVAKKDLRFLVILTQETSSGAIPSSSRSSGVTGIPDGKILKGNFYDKYRDASIELRKLVDEYSDVAFLDDYQLLKQTYSYTVDADAAGTGTPATAEDWGSFGALKSFQLTWNDTTVTNPFGTGSAALPFYKPESSDTVPAADQGIHPLIDTTAESDETDPGTGTPIVTDPTVHDGVSLVGNYEWTEIKAVYEL